MKNLYYLTTLSISAFLLIFTASCGGDTTATPGDSAIEAAENFSADSGPSAAEQACIDTYESDKAAAISTYESSAEYTANADAISAHNTAEIARDEAQEAHSKATSWAKIGKAITLATKEALLKAMAGAKNAAAAALRPITDTHEANLASLASTKDECIAEAGAGPVLTLSECYDEASAKWTIIVGQLMDENEITGIGDPGLGSYTTGPYAERFAPSIAEQGVCYEKARAEYGE